jgi:hypothetical protein
MHMSKLTVCGGGNGAQTLLPVVARNLGCTVDVYAPFGDEAERLRAGIAAHGGLDARGTLQAQARPRRVSADPAEVISGSELVVLVLPAFAHEVTLRQIAPFLDRDAWVGAIPARGGFDYCAARVLAGLGRPDVRLFGLQTLPWACRIEQYGQVVHVLGVKEAVDAASRPAAEIGAIAPLLERMLGLRIGAAASLLALTLANTGQLIHPGIMYSLFASWDGAPLDTAPLFYQGLSEEGARVLAGLSDDVQAIRARLAPRLDLAPVRRRGHRRPVEPAPRFCEQPGLRRAQGPGARSGPRFVCARFRRPLPGRGCALWPGRQPGHRRHGWGGNADHRPGHRLGRRAAGPRLPRPRRSPGPYPAKLWPGQPGATAGIYK